MENLADANVRSDDDNSTTADRALVERANDVASKITEREAKKSVSSPQITIRSKDGKGCAGESAGARLSKSGSNADICRICHMGHQAGTSTSSSSSLLSSCVEARSSSSANLDLGHLVSACRCRGTVGLVHTKCLERWLTESGHQNCELCGYRYATVRVPKHGLLRSMIGWLKTFVATRQMLLDSLYLLVSTPLAGFSAYVCIVTLKMIMENRIGDVPWTVIAMLPTCSLTLFAYWGWLTTLHRMHGRRWRQYWESNFVVQLLTDIPVRLDSEDNEFDLANDQLLFEVL
ncbi:hypothetical protein TKK_0005469 [Trichogramma kaykai]